MKTITRRTLLASTAFGLTAATVRGGVRIGVTDWNLRQTTKLEAVGFAAKLGFSAVEVSCGRIPVDGKLPLDNRELVAQYRAAAKEHKITLASTCLDILHVDGLKNSPKAPQWVADSIRITQEIGAKVILLPFFGQRQIKLAEERLRVGDLLKELAPAAEKAGVILGLENTNSAEENVGIMERVGSPAVKVFYDVGNSTGQGFDVYKEIRWLGDSRICQVHLKDNPGYLGAGKIDFPQILNALGEIRFKGFADLETSAPSGSIEDDMRKNLEFLKRA